MAGYGTDEGFATWLTSFGYELPSGSESAAVLRQRGSAYVDGLYGVRFPGTPTGGLAQERAWPREDAEVYGVTLDDDVIPDRVIQASYAAALYEAENPNALTPTATPGQTVKREKVGPIETEYFQASQNTAVAATPLLTLVEGLLAPLLVSNTPYIAVV
jgi:hypothetical protein